MKKTWSMVVSAALALLFVVAMVTGLLGAGHVGGHAVRELHEWSSYLMVFALVGHVVIYWPLIWAKVTGGPQASPARRTWGGAALWILIIVSGLALAAGFILGKGAEHERRGYPGGPGGAQPGDMHGGHLGGPAAIDHEKP